MANHDSAPASAVVTALRLAGSSNTSNAWQQGLIVEICPC